MDKSTCNGPECTRPAKTTGGLCKSHYEQRRQHGEMWEIGTRRKSFEQRFWEKVDKNGPAHPYRPELGRCWVWTAFKNPKGYGTIGYKGKVEAAHRMSWRMVNGDIPDGSVVDHTCHNPACVRPNHLRAATAKQNAENRQGAQSNNQSTGVRGVYLSPHGRFVAAVRHNQETVYLGTFATVEEAGNAVTSKRNELFTHNDVDRLAGEHLPMKWAKYEVL